MSKACSGWWPKSKRIWLFVFLSCWFTLEMSRYLTNRGGLLVLFQIIDSTWNHLEKIRVQSGVEATLVFDLAVRMLNHSDSVSYKTHKLGSYVKFLPNYWDWNRENQCMVDGTAKFARYMAITKGKTPVPVCSPKLSPVGQGWYMDGWPSG